jgi:phosphoglycerate dehydrogenase-like enzyme
MLNAETRGLIGADLLRRMKPTAYFLNAARGPIVVEPDLVEALRSGWIAGAGLDVFEQEPPPEDHPLFQMENVILAPHAICWTHECFQAIGESAIRSILSVERGERPFGMVNPEVWGQPGFQAKLARRSEL